MNPTLQYILEIIQIAGPIASAAGGGTTAADINIAESLVAIAQKANAAYQAQVGKPIDPSLLQPFTPLT